MGDSNGDVLIYLEAVQTIKNAILQSRYRTAATANAGMLGLYYGVGRYISDNTRTGKWGTGAIETISKQLQGEIPGLKGFSPSNMKNMRLFYEQWSPELEQNRQSVAADLTDENEAMPNRQSVTGDLGIESELLLIRQSVTGELEEARINAFLRTGFTHHIEILSKCKNIDERWYYVLRCADEFWGVRRLRDHLKANDYKTYGNLPNNFVLTIPDEKTAKAAIRSFRDEYLLDYVDIKDPNDYDERDVGSAIVAQIKKFIMTMGEGFCFISNDYRLIVGDEEFFVDLLFFERNLQCLVAIELKRDKFRPSDLGQLSFYLSALDKYVRKPNENRSVGLLLCQKMSKSVVELAVQDYDKPVGVATYSLGTGIPEPYKALTPLIDGVQQILTNSENENKQK